jgi:hypothetical protein
MQIDMKKVVCGSVVTTINSNINSIISIISIITIIITNSIIMPIESIIFTNSTYILRVNISADRYEKSGLWVTVRKYSQRLILLV